MIFKYVLNFNIRKCLELPIKYYKLLTRVSQSLKEIIIIITFCMNCIREIPPEYLENCPVIDERYKVLFKLGSGRFSKYSFY